MFQRFSFSVTSRILLSAFLMTSASVALAAPANSSPPAREKAQGKAREKHTERMMARLQKELDLTPGQAEQVREILTPDTSLNPGARGGKAHRPDAFDRSDMPFFGNEFADQLRADHVDTAALNRGFAERQARVAEYRKMKVFKLVQLHGVLTPAQRLKMADLIEKRSTSKSRRK